jgi:hypothetical protein
VKGSKKTAGCEPGGSNLRNLATQRRVESILTPWRKSPFSAASRPIRESRCRSCRRAGKWGEWYPDILDRDGRLTINLPKPYWQSGWLKQHERKVTLA